jgi:predicted CXXCH cytochrome family protein
MKMNHKNKRRDRFSAEAFLRGLLLLSISAIFLWNSVSLESRVSGQRANPGNGKRKLLDPKVWGDDHSGKPVPEYVQGDECLFCHRNDIGTTWQKNTHGVTVRHHADAPELKKMLDKQTSLIEVADQIEYFLGSRRHIRFLKKEGYGKFAILNARAILDKTGQTVKFTGSAKPAWDNDKFADRCAGCHATAVDSSTRAFSQFGLDCYTCHGVVDLNHSKDISLILLSKKRRNDPKVITSLCAQCHLREGRSRSSGLPYPNNFVAGDNLFRDFEVDFIKADDQKMNAGDRHIWRNVRDVVLYGNESITCLSCHQVHTNTSFKHRRVLRTPLCSECHQGEGFKKLKPYTATSFLCEY